MTKTVQPKTARNKPGVTKTATHNAEAKTARLTLPADVADGLRELAAKAGSTPAELLGQFIPAMVKEARHGNYHFSVIGFDPATQVRLRLAAAREEERGNVAEWIRDAIAGPSGTLEATEDDVECEASDAARKAYCDAAGLPEQHPFRFTPVGNYRRFSPTECGFTVKSLTQDGGALIVTMEVVNPWGGKVTRAERFPSLGSVEDGRARIGFLACIGARDWHPRSIVGKSGRCIVTDGRPLAFLLPDALAGNDKPQGKDARKTVMAA